MAPNALLDQQKIALTIGAEARAAAVRRTSPLVQEGVGGSIDRLSALTGSAEGSRLALESARRTGLMFPDTFAATHFSPFGFPRGSTSRPAAQGDLPRDIGWLAVSPTMQHHDVVSHITAIRDLLQREQVSAARRLLGLIPIGDSEEPALTRLRRALTPPTVRPSIRRDGDRTRAYEWLRQRGWEYRGQWVAVAEDGLIAAAPTLKQLREHLEALGPKQQPLIHRL